MPRIVVGVDGSEGARRALRWAVDEARVRGAELDVVHAWHVPYAGSEAYAMVSIDPAVIEDGAQETLEVTLASADVGGLAVNRHVVCGPAAPTLLELSQGADMLVVGSRGHGGFTGLLLGSVSQQVIHHAPCPVVVVPTEP